MASADNTATFVVALDDQTSGPAQSAQKAIEQLQSSIERDTKALAQLQKMMKGLQGGAQVNIAQYKALKAQIDAKKESIAKAQGAIVDLGGSLTQTRKPSNKFAEALAAMQKQAQGVGGPLGGVVGRMGALKALVTGGGAVSLGIVAVVAALAALVIAAGAATA